MNSIKINNITKKFNNSNNAILNNVSFLIEKGKVQSLVGQNGSGKTTLINIINGIYDYDEGSLYFDDKKISKSSPILCKKHKIGIVHQESNLIDKYTIIDNILLNQEENYINKYKRIDYPKAIKRFDFITNKYKLFIDPFKNYSSLNVAEKKLVDILRVLWIDKDFIIFDEPTDAISSKDINRLIILIKNLAKSNIGILFISHKIDEVLEVSDYIYVLRRGIMSNRINNDKSFNKNNLLNILIENKGDNKSKHPFVRKNTILGNPKLIIENLSLKRNNISLLNNINLKIRNGEIFGISGLDGNGQKYLLDVLTKKVEDFEGKIFLGNKDYSKYSPKDLQNILSYIPSNIQSESILNSRSLELNAMFTSYGNKKFLKYSFYRNKKIITNIESNNLKQIFYKWVATNKSIKIYLNKDNNISNINIYSFDNNMLSSIKVSNMKKRYFSYNNLIPSTPYRIEFIFNDESSEKFYFSTLWKPPKIKKIKILNETRYGTNIKINYKKGLGTTSESFKVFVNGLNGKPINETIIDIKDSIENKVFLIKGYNKKQLKSALDFDIYYDQIYEDLKLQKKFILNNKKIKFHTESIINNLDLKGVSSTKTLIDDLSGGNQQKFILGRETMKNHEIFIANLPTKGLDVKSIEKVFTILDQNSINKTTILVSHELTELISICDRIAIFKDGSINKIIDTKKVDIKNLYELVLNNGDLHV